MLANKLDVFEKFFDVLNTEFFEDQLSKPVITISPSARSHGHFTPWQSWEDGEAGYFEINLSAETVNRPFAYVIATLLHEMTHQFCHENGIKDTSRNGYYHNARFKAEAERHGLTVAYDPTIGWSKTRPSIELEELIARGTLREAEKGLHRPELPQKRLMQSSRKYICPKCGCSVRATKRVHIACLDCGQKMVTEDDETQ